MPLLEGCLCNSAMGKRNIDDGSFVITNTERFLKNNYGILDRFLAELRFTTNELVLNLLKSFAIASEKFMDITNLENVANCYSNHLDDVVLLSQAMQQKHLSIYGISHQHMWHLLLKVQSIQIL